MLIDPTPVEKHNVSDIDIYVKREDLCTPPPGPTFSKMRGLLKRLQLLKDKGYETVGYTESSISMAGWGVAWLAPKVGMKAVIFDPQYVESNTEPHLKILEYHRFKWKELGAEIVPIKAGMVKVNYHICKAILNEKYPKSIMLPLGLPFEETIDETARVARWYNGHFKTVVVCIGSGTICAGLIRGMPQADIFGVMSRSPGSDKAAALKCVRIFEKAGVLQAGLFGREKPGFAIIDDKWKYTDPSKVEAPFPCHPYYDLKAWEWLIKNITKFEQPILFWNIGS